MLKKGGLIMLYGVRFTDKEYEVGDVIEECSRVWEDGSPTDKKLPGVSIIALADEYDKETKKLGLLAPYLGEWYHEPSAELVMAIFSIAKTYKYPYAHAYIVGGKEVCAGEDYYEYIVESPEVFYKLW